LPSSFSWIIPHCASAHRCWFGYGALATAVYSPLRGLVQREAPTGEAARPMASPVHALRALAELANGSGSSFPVLLNPRWASFGDLVGSADLKGWPAKGPKSSPTSFPFTTSSLGADFALARLRRPGHLGLMLQYFTEVVLLMSAFSLLMTHSERFATALP